MVLGEQTTTTSESSPGAIDAPERLYSTPLSWDPPQPGLHLETPFFAMNPPLTDLERQRLLAIALGTGQVPSQPSTRPQSGMDFRFDVDQSPTAKVGPFGNVVEPKAENPMTTPKPPSRTSSAGVIEKKEKPRSSDRAAHNDIERKYRTNLKDRIAELRDAIPSLRTIQENDEDGRTTSSRSAPKVSKGTVLSKATEYIHQLERRNRSMAQKNEELARRLQAFEQLVGAGAPGPNWQPQGYGAAVFNPRGFS